MSNDLIATQTELITGEELFRMGDIGPCELIDGQIVSKPYDTDEHACIEGNLGYAVSKFLKQHKIGKAGVGGVGVYIRRNPDTVRAADLFFMSNARYNGARFEGYLETAPDLIAEIVSDTDAWSDVTQKLRDYFSIGVRLVWIADPQTRSVYAYRSITDVREFTSNDDLPGDDVLPGFNVKVAELFEI
jgi:Uma2 family endonuclease